MPRQMLSVANVMMKGCGRRPNTYTAPLTNPTARPVATMAAMMMAEESVTLNNSPPITVARARFAPTERSMPRVRMTRCWPSATIAITDVCARMLPTFAGFRNTGVVMLTTTIRITRMRIGPALKRRSASKTKRRPHPALAALGVQRHRRPILHPLSLVLCLLLIKIVRSAVVKRFFMD